MKPVRLNRSIDTLTRISQLRQEADWLLNARRIDGPSRHDPDVRAKAARLNAAAERMSCDLFYRTAPALSQLR